MIYSRFIPERGLYDYYDAPEEQRPINGDLPIPKMPGVVNGIGAPAMLAGRPLPPSARYVGSGALARGMIAAPDGSSLGSVSLPSADQAVTWVKNGGWIWLAGGALAIAVLRKL